MNRVYPKAKQASISNTLGDLASLNIKAVLVRTVGGTNYTFSAAHEFLSDIPVGARTATSGNLGTKTVTDGVFDAADVTVSAVPGGNGDVGAIVVYIDTGTAGTSRLLSYLDGRVQVEVAVNAAINATAITVEDLLGILPNGAVLDKISGTGPATLTTTAEAAAGARSIAVSAAASAVNAGAVYEYAVKDCRIPITPNGGDLTLAWPSNGIFF
jgi:hypothetical protein